MSLYWHWNINPSKPDTIAFNLQLQPHIGNLSVGTYALFDHFTVEVPVGVEDDQQSLLKTSSYPNPASEEVYIAFEAAAPGEGVIQIMDMTGRVLIEHTTSVQPAGWTTEQFHSHTLAAGNYLALIRIRGRLAHKQVDVVR